mmetsp:Transcript_34914/g.53601  ORF Transcript_34914/g.53601 Transcript_34914/m.53601 type:complete len:83 (+) Transcript_34914:928-1176(+)
MTVQHSRKASRHQEKIKKVQESMSSEMGRDVHLFGGSPKKEDPIGIALKARLNQGSVYERVVDLTSKDPVFKLRLGQAYALD